MAAWYRNEILEPIVRLYATAIGPIFVLMDDNACPHRAAIVDDYLESEEIAHGQHIRPTLILLKIFRMLPAVLYLHVSQLQPISLN